MDSTTATETQFQSAFTEAVGAFLRGEGAENNVQTIKAMREATRHDDGGVIGLREAKEMYDALRDIYRKGQSTRPLSDGSLALSPDQAQALAKASERSGERLFSLQRRLVVAGLDHLSIGHCRICGGVQELDDNGYCSTCPRVARF